ncbi:MAG: PKD domain-containing protein [Acidobacteriota bacterium]
MKRAVLCSVLCFVVSGTIFAQSTANPFVYVDANDQRQACLGIAGRDTGPCSSVSDFNDRQVCSGLAASSQAPCFSMTDRNLQLTCFGLAFAPNFPSNCRDITDAGLRDFCFSAASWGTQGTCSLVSDPADNALCQALTYRDSSYCAAITNADDRQFCLAVSVHDNSPCAAIAAAPGAGGPYTVNEGGSVVVTASGGASYNWDLDNDGSFETPGQSATFSAAALDGPGSQTISVQVTASDGQTATAQATVNITNVAPTATFNAPSSASAGGPINLSLTAPVDVAADLPTLQYAFDCGSGFGPFGGSSTAACVAPDTGTVTVRGQVRDKDGGVNIDSATVTITGSSVTPDPYSVPASNDTTFVVDQGSGLDTGCFSSGDHSLIINIPVTRVVGEKFALIRNGFMQATATLRLPAFDVDFAGGSGINPERDRVYFNGIPVPAQFLTGQSDNWALNTLTIDSTWINFPSDPGNGNTPVPATNTVRIDIDTGNTEIPSCTSVDWAALSIRVARPVLLVHGFLIANEWGTWEFRLRSVGLPYYAADVGTLSTIRQNAIQLAAQVPMLRRRWGVDSMNILAHSKGGLDSRDYVENNNTVPTLFQIGSPNGGTPLADLARIAARILDIGGFVDFLAPGLRDLTIENMAFYNLFHGHNPRTQYVSLAGEYKFSGFFSFIPNGFFSLVFGGANDLVVPAWSVRNLGYAQRITYKSKGGNHQAIHGNQPVSSDIANLVFPYLKVQAGSSTLSSAGFSSSETPRKITAASEEDEPASALNTTRTTADTIEPGQIKTQTLYVDGPEPIALTLLHGAGELSLSVISPSGIRYDSSVPADDPEVQFEFVDGDDLHVQLFVVNSPEVGTWTFEVSAPGTADGPQAYVLTGVLPESPIQLAATTDQSIYHRGNPIVVRASLTDESAPVAGASVGATIRQGDSSPAAFTLVDDGTGDDLHAGDGIYSGRFAATAQEGLYEILVSAAGPASAPFHRERLLQARVSASTSRLNGTFSDRGDDADSDGLFDDLEVQVGIDVTASRPYRMLGELADANGHLITTATALADLDAGTATVALRFDGATIYRHGADGPYQLRVVRVAEDDGSAILPLDELVNAYSTASYDHRQFQHPALAALGQNVTTDEDTPVELTLGADSIQPGALTFSVVSAPSHGILGGTAPHLTYTPEPDFNGPDLFTFSVSNGTTDSEVASVFITVNPVNDPPVADAGGPYAANEGDPVTLDASRSADPDTDGEITRYEWDLDGDGAYDDATGATVTTAFGDQGTYVVGLRVTDDQDESATATAQATVLNVAPVVGPISAPSGPSAVNTVLSASATFTDPGVRDTHTAVWDWNDGSTSAGTVLETGSAKSVRGTHIYTASGVYTVKLTVTDKDGGASTVSYQYIVIYNPDGAFVTGGGWLTSPEGAYPADPSLTGRANFGFVSKYKTGQTVPTGQTQFQFQIANLSFQSETYEWLVVAGARAEYKGVGKINGAGSYGFLITAVDGQISGGGGSDKLHMKIWDRASGRIVYDNQIGGTGEATTSIQGGSIVIHSR